MLNNKMLLLYFLCFAPVILTFINLFINKKLKNYFRWSTFSLLTVLSGILILSHCHTGAHDETHLHLGIMNFWFGIDHLSSVLLILTQALALIVVFLAPHFLVFENNEKIFFNSILTLVIGLNLTFLARDLISFYIGWEIALIGAFILIATFGRGDKVKTAISFFIYTFTGSLFLLMAFAMMAVNAYNATGIYHTSFNELVNYPMTFDTWASPQGLAFLAMTFAFLIKAPVMPLHAWMKRTYTETPSIVLILIAGCMGKMGTYAMARFMPFYTEAYAQAAPCLMLLASVGILYGAILAIQSKELKEVITFSSLSHISYIVLGIFALNSTAMSGAIAQMFNHGIIIAGLFILLAHLEKEGLTNVSGLQKVAPKLSVLFFIYTLASIGLPGTNGFTGEFLIFLGAFKTSISTTMLGMIGIVLGAVYMLKTYSKHFLGEIETASIPGPLGKKTGVIAVTIAIIIIVLGIFPMVFFKQTHSMAHVLTLHFSQESK